MKRKFLGILVFSGLFISGLSNHALAASNKARVNNGLPEQALMDGFSTDMQVSEGLTCLKPTGYDFVGGSKVVINMGDTIDFKDIQKYLNVDISHEGSIGIFSQDAAANYARYIQKDQYSEAFYYIERVRLPTKRMNPPLFGEDALNAIGLSAYHAGPDQFRLCCGDQYIQETPLGANLFVTLKLNFNRTIVKKNFDDHAGGSLGALLTIGDDLQQLVNQYHIQGDLDITAYQAGGDPMRLTNIFTKSQKGYYVMRCQLNNLDACKQIINGVLNYAQKDFKNQIDFKEGQIIGNAVPLDYTYKQYLTLGLTVGQSLVTAPVLDARLKLGSLYKTFMTKLKFVNHLLNSSSAPLFKEPYKSRLVQEAADLQYDINLLQDPYNGAIGCYLTPDHCVAIANTIQNDLKPIDDAIINQYKLGYFVNVVLGGQTLLYYSIPLGGDQYYSVELPTFNPTSYQLGLSLTDGGNTLVLDEIDVAGNHITGNMRKIAEGVYQGNQIYADHTRFTTFSFIENPL